MSSSYKQQIIDDGPVSFWTFDTDGSIPANSQIRDEIGTENLFIMGDSYRTNQFSLIEPETSLNYSMLIPQVVDHTEKGIEFPKTTLQTLHNELYNFEDFTIEINFKCASPTEIRNSYTVPDTSTVGYHTEYEIGYQRTIITPLINKDGLINVHLYHYYSNSNAIQQIHFNVMGENFVYFYLPSSTVYADGYPDTPDRPSSFYNQPVYNVYNNLVIRYKIEELYNGTFTKNIKIILNGRTIINYEGTEEYSEKPKYETPAELDPLNPMGDDGFNIAGNSRNAGDDPVTDFATEELFIDQISIYDKALTEEQLVRHYSLATQFNTMIKRDRPKHYIRMNDDYDGYGEAANIVNPDYNMKLYPNFTKSAKTMTAIVDSDSILFSNGGSGIVGEIDKGTSYQVMDITKDYTVEFWFNFTDNRKGVIFSAHSDTPNWNGLVIYANSKNDIQEVGSIQVAENKDVTINSLNSNFNDGNWHHLVVVRYGNVLILKIDNFEQAKIVIPPVQSQYINYFTIANDYPTQQFVDIHISELALYNYAVDDTMIATRVLFNTRFIIYGHVLLRGYPVESTVRLYDDYSGELLQTTLSSPYDGAYTFHTLNNRRADIVARIPNRDDIRYKILAPIIPSPL